MERTVNTKFYSFSQNNSGGHFDIDEKRGITKDNFLDLMLAMIPIAVITTRLYYVIFYDCIHSALDI